VHDAGRDGAAERRRERAGMVVDDVELALALEAGERVVEVIGGVADELRRRFRVDVREPGLCLRLARGEERDLVAGANKPVGEQRDDPFDAAVTAWWDWEPRRGEDRDSQGCLNPR
jgi:hypothetical protein